MKPDDWRNMWRDQYNLNRLFRPDGPPTNFAERTALTKEMVLHLHSETDELLRKSGAWKPHRRQEVLENRAAILEELTDIQKYVISLYQTWGFTPEEAIESFRHKDMVVRQRHAEEWIKQLDRPSAVVDLDGVLADYKEGFLNFLSRHPLVPYQAEPFLRKEPWIGHEAMSRFVTPDVYRQLRHEFCTSGQFGKLPMIPGASTFMNWVADEGYQIIIVTSRPIDRYPNVYTDTLVWLDNLQLPFDFIWWTGDKGRIILERDMTKHVLFAVDDDWTFVSQLSNAGVPTFWMKKEGEFPPGHVAKNIVKVTSLKELMEHIGETAHE